MLTYQDLLEVGENERERALFCVKAVNQFKTSDTYKNAMDGECYYAKHNLTIEKFQKFLYTLTGKKVPDLFSANYKLKTTFFRRLVQQQVQYVLANGVSFSKDETKGKLGKDFDYKLVQASKHAMAGGTAFGFWNYDHLEVFSYVDTVNDTGFCPLYDETDAKLRAGIRFWSKVAGDKIVFRATLYEEDGYTEYVKQGSKEPEVLEDKKPYTQTVYKTNTGYIEAVVGENYTSLPIVPLYANDTQESELVGIRECIDCYDYIKSGLANDIDDTSGFYWVLKNAGGMDDVDLAKFIQRMKTTKATTIGEDDTVEARTLDIPVEARTKMLEILRKDIYEDFQVLDVNTLSASAKTTQEIQASYQAQDNKCADFEYYLIDFVQKILELAGIEDNPVFNWNKIINQSEVTNMILASGQYLTEEMVIKKLPFLTPEEAQEVIDARLDESYQQFNAPIADDLGE